MKALLVAVLVLVGAGVLVASWQEPSGAVCPTGDPAQAGSGSVAGYSGEQLANADTILRTASGMGLDEHAQMLGVMAAMGESGLRTIAYGDFETSGVRNPDGTPTSSIGLFQQQDWWGSREERMDPAGSAALFFARLTQIDGWETRPASEVIHDVQVNADPEHYAGYQSAAERVTAALLACG